MRIPSPTTREVVVTTPYIPGLELHIPPHTVIRGEDGKSVTEVGITAIPVDRPPFPLAKNVENRNAAWRRNIDSLGAKTAAASFVIFGLLIIYVVLARLVSSSG